MKKHFIWLDDERPIRNDIHTIEKYITVHYCRSAAMAIETLKAVPREEEIFMSFDHDLGHGKSGYDVAKWIVENHFPLTAFAVHSMNPVGAKNIRDLLTHYGYAELHLLNDIIKI